MKKKISILLALAICALSLAGCAATEPYTGPSPVPGMETTMDFDSIYATMPADSVIMTVDGSDVKWGEYYHWVYYLLSSIVAQDGEIESMDAVYPYGDGVQTYADFVDDTARDLCVQYHALEVNAANAGVMVDETDEEELSARLAEDIIAVCGEGGTEEQFFEALEVQYMSREDYEYINSIALLYTKCFDEMFGATGEKLDDAEVLAFADTNSYLNVKHILFSTTDAEGAELPESEKNEKLASANSVYESLADEKDLTKRLARFDELMNDYSEDPGLAYYPDGYCFAPGTMHAEFEAAAEALTEYGVSEPVTTVNGYHVIIRLPMDPEATLVSSTTGGTVRYTAAQSAFDNLVGAWVEGAETKLSPAFESFELGKLFA